jgi:hypothetical protein
VLPGPNPAKEAKVVAISYDASMIGRSEWERLAGFFEDMAQAARSDEAPEGADPAEVAWARSAALVRVVAEGRTPLD